MSHCCNDFTCAKCQERRAAKGKLLAGVDVNRIQDKVSGPPPVVCRFPQDRLPGVLLRDFQKRNKAIGERIEERKMNKRLEQTKRMGEVPFHLDFLRELGIEVGKDWDGEVVKKMDDQRAWYVGTATSKKNGKLLKMKKTGGF